MRIVLIGATSAIAQATARSFATRERAAFALFGRSVERLETVAADLRAHGAGESVVFPGELTDAGNARAALPRAEAALGGPVDLVLIAQGSLPDEARAAADPEYAAREAAINFLSPVWFANAAVEHWRGRGQRGAQIAIITSVAGDRGRASNRFYGACKAGLIAFTSGLRAGSWRHGITVTDLRPGTIDTPMTAGLPRKGPLVCSAGRAGELCAAAIRARRPVAYIPGFWRAIMLVIKLLPGAVFKRLRF